MTTDRTSCTFRAGFGYFLLFLVVFGISMRGLGYRHLWQDEIETAERARTILESGYPRVIDASGAVSVNTGGREIEDGNAHRYTPWVQFYFAAAGLYAAKALDSSADAGVRAPFALAHSIQSVLIAHGVRSFLSASLPLALCSGLIFSLQTTRLTYNRSARYHALLDLFALLGIWGVALLKQGRKIGGAIFASVIILAPHTHTVGGAYICIALSIIFVFSCPLIQQPMQCVKQILLWLILPGLLSLLGLLVLTRPWAQGAWGVYSFANSNFQIFIDFPGINYSYLFPLIYLVCCACAANWWRAFGYLCIALTTAASAVLLEGMPFAQSRYFLSTPLLLSASVFAVGLSDKKPALQKIAAILVIIVALSAELFLGRYARFQNISVPFAPFHGVRIALNDAVQSVKKPAQPLKQAFQIISSDADANSAVLIDYVPQYVNWYLPGHRVALMPDQTLKTELNQDNSIWKTTPPMPDWHLWYPDWIPGLWTCHGGCDFKAENYSPDSDRYLLSSKIRAEKIEMCKVKSWRTHQWNNAPMILFTQMSLLPSGPQKVTLLLAKRCDKQ